MYVEDLWTLYSLCTCIFLYLLHQRTAMVLNLSDSFLSSLILTLCELKEKAMMILDGSNKNCISWACATSVEKLYQLQCSAFLHVYNVLLNCIGAPALRIHVAVFKQFFANFAVAHFTFRIACTKDHHHFNKILKFS